MTVLLVSPGWLESLAPWLIFVPRSFLAAGIVGLALFKFGWRSTVFGVLLLLLLFSLGRGPEKSVSDVVVVSLNANSWKGDLERIGRELSRLRPDVVLFQEVWEGRHFWEAAKGLVKSNYYFLREEHPKRGEMAILSRYRLNKVKLPPPLKGVAARIETTHGKMVLASTHRERMRGGLARELRAAAHYNQELARFIEGQGSVVVGADLNIVPNSRAGRLVAEFDSARKVEGFWCATYPAAFPLWRPDYVLVGSGAPLEPVALRVENWGSDHRAVVVRLRYK